MTANLVSPVKSFLQQRHALAAKEKQLSLRLRKENRETMEAPQGRPFLK